MPILFITFFLISDCPENTPTTHSNSNPEHRHLCSILHQKATVHPAHCHGDWPRSGHLRAQTARSSACSPLCRLPRHRLAPGTFRMAVFKNSCKGSIWAKIASCTNYILDEFSTMLVRNTVFFCVPAAFCCTVKWSGKTEESVEPQKKDSLSSHHCIHLQPLEQVPEQWFPIRN